MITNSPNKTPLIILSLDEREARLFADPHRGIPSLMYQSSKLINEGN